MDDLISRQDAIDVVQNRHMMLNKEKVLLINDLEKLPSSQPEPCEDAVSREAAIDALCANCRVDTPETCLTIQSDNKWCEEVYILQHLPSVTPKQRTGKWIFTKDYYWICSECGKNPTRGVGYVQGSSELFPHCPYCGSRNEVTT